mmetsp:Transcript_3941/g.6497  ORF Transcript_3941/g.6497 Transcript_3941/m.6497 type:complete len:218 (+) Transcript_3941:1982-2635(+)
MLPNVLKVGGILFGAHGAFSQHEFTICLACAQMSTLLVRGRPLAHLHEETLAGVCEVGQQLEVQCSAEVIGVGHKHVLLARVHQLLQHGGAHDGRVDVPMPRRTPLKVVVGRVGDGLQGSRIHLGAHVLHELYERLIQEVRSLRGGLQVVTRVLAGAEAVHEGEHHLATKRGPHVLHLEGDEVQEVEAILDTQQALGLFQTHGCAQPPVEFEHHSFR